MLSGDGGGGVISHPIDVLKITVYIDITTSISGITKIKFLKTFSTLDSVGFCESIFLILESINPISIPITARVNINNMAGNGKLKTLAIALAQELD